MGFIHDAIKQIAEDSYRSGYITAHHHTVEGGFDDDPEGSFADWWEHDGADDDVGLVNINEVFECLERVANFLRGMTFDHRIPKECCDVLGAQIIRIERLIEEPKCRDE